MATTTSEMTPAAPAVTANGLTKAWRWFFHRGRGDSPFRTVLIHAALIVACIIAVYPILRVVTISLRPNDSLLTTSLRIIPEGATLDNYKEVLFGNAAENRDSDFFLWLWNSFSITITTSIIATILAAVAAYAFSRFKFPGRGTGLVFLLTTQMIPA